MTDNLFEKRQPVILRVDDDEHISYLLDFLLERQGYQVVSAKDGQEFLDIIKMQKGADLIMLDIMLPFMDGYEIMRQIRALPVWKNTPIIALSSLKKDKDIVRAFNAGASDYVTKPFQPLELMVRVDRLLRQQNNVASSSI